MAKLEKSSSDFDSNFEKKINFSSNIIEVIRSVLNPLIFLR